VSKTLAPKHTFPGYDQDDIEQEGILIGVSLLKKYDPEFGELKDFLFIAIRNRLRSLRRVNYDNQKSETSQSLSKKNLQEVLPIKNNRSYDHPFEDLEIQEMLDTIISFLHPHEQRDYQKVREGIFVPTKRRREIMNKVRYIYDMILENRIGEIEEGLRER
jgi:hypothetical protein